ncbi:MAG: TrgA family protein [Proteobacteria bacterium]|nr:TrgA family protein [Pseudomonadota bacterium]
MPTAAKLVGGIILALTATYITFLFLGIKTTMGVAEELYIINGIIGFLLGWRSIGRDPGFGGFGSILAGLRGGILFMTTSAIIYGVWVVILKLERFFIRQFDDVLVSWFEETVAYLAVMIDPNVLVVLVVGSIASGIGAGFANRFWV